MICSSETISEGKHAADLNICVQVAVDFYLFNFNVWQMKRAKFASSWRSNNSVKVTPSTQR